jgi:ribose transport system substrate-binding protein
LTVLPDDRQATIHLIKRRKNKVKKLGIVILCLLLALTLFACSGGNDTADTPAADAPVADTAAEDAAADTPAADTAVAEASSAEQEAPAPAEPDAADTSVGIATYDDFDPQTTTDTVNVEDLDGVFGALPDIPEGFSIGSVTNEPSNEYWAQVGQGIEDRANELGITIDQQFALGTEDQSGQLAAMEALAGKDYDCYIVSPLTMDNLQGVVDDLMNQGKYVVNPYLEILQNCDVFVGSLDSICAQMAAEHAIEVMGGEGEAAMALGAVASQITQVRCGSFKEYLEANSNAKVVAEMPAEWVPETAMQMTMDLLTTNPDIKVIWCANDNLAMGVIEGVRAQGLLDQVKVMAMDGTSVGLQAVADGEMEATYFNDPYMIGQISVEIGVRLMTGQKINRVVVTPITQVTIDNVADFV